MPTLFVKTGCQYCKKVLDTAAGLGFTLDQKNIADESVLAELLMRGGKKQVPYLMDEERGVAMYESDAIVDYLVRRCKGDPNICLPDFT